MGKENDNRSTNLYDGKVQLMSRSSSQSLISKADKQKRLFQDTMKSRNIDSNSDFISSNDESDNLKDSYHNEKHKKKLKKLKEEEFRILIQKCEQLYGKHYPNDEVFVILILSFFQIVLSLFSNCKERKCFQMIHLKYNVYCRKRIFDSALSVASQVTHLIRRLIEGVFKIEKLLDCTLTGQSPRTQGKEKINKQFDSLDFTAKMAIQGNL